MNKNEWQKLKDFINGQLKYNEERRVDITMDIFSIVYCGILKEMDQIENTSSLIEAGY